MPHVGEVRAWSNERLLNLQELPKEVEGVRPRAAELLRELCPNVHSTWVEILAALIMHHKKESELQESEQSPAAAARELDRLAKAMHTLNKAAQKVSRNTMRSVITGLEEHRPGDETFLDDYSSRRLDSLQFFVFNNSGESGMWVNPRLLSAVERTRDKLRGRTWGKRRAASVADEAACIYANVTGEPPPIGREGAFVRFLKGIFKESGLTASAPDAAKNAAGRHRRKVAVA